MIFPLVTTGLGLAGHAYGQYRNAQAGKEKRAINKRMSDENEAWWKGEYYRDPLEQTHNRSFLNTIQNQYRDALKSSKQNAVTRGATAESQVAAGGALSQKYADAVNKMVSGATAYRQNVDRIYRNRKDNLEKQKQQFLEEEQKSWGNFGNNVAQSMAGLNQVYAQGGFDDMFSN